MFSDQEKILENLEKRKLKKASMNENIQTKAESFNVKQENKKQ